MHQYFVGNNNIFIVQIVLAFRLYITVIIINLYKCLYMPWFKTVRTSMKLSSKIIMISFKKLIIFSYARDLHEITGALAL